MCGTGTGRVDPTSSRKSRPDAYHERTKLLKNDGVFEAGASTNARVRPSGDQTGSYAATFAASLTVEQRTAPGPHVSIAFALHGVRPKPVVNHGSSIASQPVREDAAGTSATGGVRPRGRSGAPGAVARSSAAPSIVPSPSGTDPSPPAQTPIPWSFHQPSGTSHWASAPEDRSQSAARPPATGTVSSVVAEAWPFPTAKAICLPSGDQTAP